MNIHFFQYISSNLEIRWGDFLPQWNCNDLSRSGIHLVHFCVALTLAETFGVTFGDGWGAEFHAAEHPQYNVGVTTWDPCSKRFQMGWALDKASCLTCFTEYESWNMFLIRFHSLVQGEAFHTFSGSLRTSGGGWDQGRRVPFCGISGGYWMILVYVDYSLIDG